MLTGELKNKIDSLWEMFWTGGITNPLDVVEQMTYLMFIHNLDETDAKKAKSSLMLELPYTSMFEGHDQYKWSVFRDLPAEKMYELMQTEIFPFIKNLHGSKESTYSQYMSDAIFKIPTPQLLSKIVDALDNIYIDMAKSMNTDTKGDVYEHLLAKLATAGVNGQFRTPRHIIRMMVELMDPKPEDTICDPACGTSGFLVSAGEYLKEKYHNEIFYNREKKDHYNNHMFFGYDMDRTMLRVGAMNMMTHGVDNPNIAYRDSLSDQNTDNGKYSMILANPPFTGSLDEEDIDSTLSAMVKTKKTELLFLARILQMLKVGGRSATIVPQGVLFGSSKAHQSLRKTLVEDNQLEAVINLPSGVFKPYAGVATAILIFTKGGQTDEVWFYDLQNDGYSLDDKRNPIKDNDLPHLLASWKHYRTLRGLPVDNFMGEKLASLLKQQYPEGIDAGVDFKDRTQAAFVVPKADIAAQKYDLSINRYKEVVYQAEEYEDPKVILKRLKDLEKEILADLDELEGML